MILMSCTNLQEYKPAYFWYLGHQRDSIFKAHEII